jgi:hypothetical protein
MIPVQFQKIEKEKLSLLKKKLPVTKQVQNEVLDTYYYKIVKYYKPISKIV